MSLFKTASKLLVEDIDKKKLHHVPSEPVSKNVKLLSVVVNGDILEWKKEDRQFEPDPFEEELSPIQRKLVKSVDGTFSADIKGLFGCGVRAGGTLSYEADFEKFRWRKLNNHDSLIKYLASVQLSTSMKSGFASTVREFFRSSGSFKIITSVVHTTSPTKITLLYQSKSGGSIMAKEPIGETVEIEAGLGRSKFDHTVLPLLSGTAIAYGFVKVFYDKNGTMKVKEKDVFDGKLIRKHRSSSSAADASSTELMHNLVMEKAEIQQKLDKQECDNLKMQEKMDKQECENAKMQEKIDTLERKSAKMHEKIDKLERKEAEKINILQQEKAEIQKELDTLQWEKAVMSEKTDKLEQEQADTQVKTEILVQMIAEMHDATDQLEQETTKAQKGLKEAREEKAEIQKKLEEKLHSLKQENSAIRQENALLGEMNDELQEEKAGEVKRNEDLQREVSATSKELDAKLMKIAEIEDKIRYLEEYMVILRNNWVSDIETMKEKHATAMEAINEEHTSYMEVIRACLIKIETLEDRIKALEKMTDSQSQPKPKIQGKDVLMVPEPVSGSVVSKGTADDENDEVPATDSEGAAAKVGQDEGDAEDEEIPGTESVGAVDKVGQGASSTVNLESIKRE